LAFLQPDMVFDWNPVEKRRENGHLIDGSHELERYAQRMEELGSDVW